MWRCREFSCGVSFRPEDQLECGVVVRLGELLLLLQNSRETLGRGELRKIDVPTTGLIKSERKDERGTGGRGCQEGLGRVSGLSYRHSYP